MRMGLSETATLATNHDCGASAGGLTIACSPSASGTRYEVTVSSPVPEACTPLARTDPGEAESYLSADRATMAQSNAGVALQRVASLQSQIETVPVGSTDE
jgi:hypothetical protein